MNIFTKSFISLVLLLSIVNIGVGQVHKKGNILVDAYYGFPNLTYSKWSLFTVQSYDNYSNATHFSIGPVGGRVEYMLSEKIGVGVEGSYAYTHINYDFDALDGAGSMPYEVAINKFRILPRFNFHFGKHTKLDTYIAGGVGYYYRTVVFTPNNPASGLYDAQNDITFGPNYPYANSLIPLAFTAKFGLRYYFNDRVGFVTEVGFGGPLASLGITGKF